MQMKASMGIFDKTVRILVAATIAVLYFTNQISGTVAILLFVRVASFIIKNFINFSVLYYPFGISTEKQN
jgi:hypothetical protein